jgi:hypothetical protein
LKYINGILLSLSLEESGAAHSPPGCVALQSALIRMGWILGEVEGAHLPIQ